MHKLIGELKHRQGDRSYQKYADELQISKSHLFPVLETGRPAGRKLLSAVVVALPELDDLVLQYLRDRHADDLAGKGRNNAI